MFKDLEKVCESHENIGPLKAKFENLIQQRKETYDEYLRSCEREREEQFKRAKDLNEPIILEYLYRKVESDSGIKVPHLILEDLKEIIDEIKKTGTN